MSRRPFPRVLPQMLRESLRARLVLAFAGVIALISLGMFLQFPKRIYVQALNETALNTKKLAAITSYSVSPAVMFNDSLGVAEVISATVRGGDVVYVVVTDVTGRILGEFGSHRARAADFEHERPVAAGDSLYLAHQPVLSPSGERIGTAHIGISLARVHADVASARKWIGALSLVLFLGGILVVMLLGHWLIRPLESVMAAAQRIAAGDLSARAAVSSDDDISVLSRTFNTMVEKLALAYGEVQESNRTLEEQVHRRTAELRREIVERSKAETALLESEKRFRAMFDSSAAGVALFDTNGQLLEGNRALAGLLGIDETALRELNYRQIFELESVVETTFAFDDVMAGTAGSVNLTEVALRAAGKKPVWGHMVLSAVEGDSLPAYAIAMIANISDQKQLAEMYRQSQKLEAIGRLAGGIAHDFNNLLTTINGTCDLLLPDLVVDTSLHHDVSQILGAGKRAATLTRQLLAFSRKQLMQPSILEVNSVLSGMTDLLGRLVGEGVRLNYHPTEGLPLIRADKAQLEQVVMNLVVNAKDAMPAGGTVTVSSRKVHLDLITAPLYGTVTGDYVELIVTDTGMGMDENTRDRIFEPFFTTKAVGMGTGLGLATVYGIVKQSSGGIFVESSRGQGSSFHIALPAQPHGALAETASTPSLTVSGVGTILIIEDELNVRKLFARVLERAGYTVLQAKDGTEAISISDTYPNEIHLVISDVVMPGMNGPESVHRLLTRRPNLSVIYISGYTRDVMMEQGIGDNLVRIMEKPISPADLTIAVRDSLEHHVSGRWTVPIRAA